MRVGAALEQTLIRAVNEVWTRAGAFLRIEWVGEAGCWKLMTCLSGIKHVIIGVLCRRLQ